jgi:hypothetical protein
MYVVEVVTYIMKHILEELYFGIIQPNSKRFVRGSDFGKAIRVIGENEKS